MVEIRSNTLRPLHTRPLQPFKIIEDMTTTLHQDIQRLNQYYLIMYGNTECSDQAKIAWMEEMDTLVREYEKKVPYHACGQGGIKIWAGTGDRVRQAVLWNVLEKAGVNPSIPHTMYKRVMTEFQEIVRREERSGTELGNTSVYLVSAPLSRSLAEELDAMCLDEDDRRRAETWRGGQRLMNGEGAEVGRRTASEETRGSSTETVDGNTVLTPDSEPVIGSELLGRGYDCIISPETCRCQRHYAIYLWGSGTQHNHG
jgi:hypothetical protein